MKQRKETLTYKGLTMDTENEEQEPVVVQDANRPPEDLLMPY